MHVPDGFLDAPTSVATGVVAAVGVGLALRGARRELDDRTAPMAGLVAAFVFAGQLLNFPVGAGTSGHLLGGVATAYHQAAAEAAVQFGERGAQVGPAYRGAAVPQHRIDHEQRHHAVLAGA